MFWRLLLKKNCCGNGGHRCGLCAEHVLFHLVFHDMPVPSGAVEPQLIARMLKAFPSGAFAPG